MHYLTGLEWSAGLFGLSIGVLIGCVATWFEMRPLPGPVVDEIAAMGLNELPAMEAQIYGDVPVIPPCNPLHVRMYERWLEADAAGDRFVKNRQEGRMLRAGFEPPASRDEAEAQLTTLKGSSL